MATLHLQTDLPRLSVAPSCPSTTTSRSHPNEADYAAVTPTAARPHPEKGYTSLFDMYVPPQYAFEHARESYRATSSAGSMMGYHAAGEELPFAPAAMVMDTYSQQKPTYSSSNYEQAPHDLAFSSSCSEDSNSSSAASSICTGGPQTPPERASPASSFTAVPGNTIYNAYTHHQLHGQSQSAPLMQPYAAHANGPLVSMVANNQGYPVCNSNNGTNSTQEYAPSYAPSIYGQLQYASYQPGYQTNQYAIYNGNELNGQAPAMVHPTSAQVSPHVVYNNQFNNGSIGHAVNSKPIPAASLSGDNMENYSVLQTPHPQPVYPDYQPSYAPGHGHSVSQSSISTTSLQSASPAPSLSGSDDSGNTSKSTLIYSSAGLVVRSNPSSRRGSVSSVTSNLGTPYAVSNKKDGDRKFTCSYPGCNRSFSRNFNLSTHYNTHLGIKPFPCSHCPKSFSRRHDCARHIAAVHITESKKGHSMSDGSAEEGSISPNTCGCGHTCPTHAENVSSFSKPAMNGQLVSNSAFALIKGHHNMGNEDDYSTSSSGYESTTSTQSFDSFISDNFNGLINNNRSPSIGTVSNASLDFGLVKLEDGVGE